VKRADPDAIGQLPDISWDFLQIAVRDVFACHMTHPNPSRALCRLDKIFHLTDF